MKPEAGVLSCPKYRGVMGR